MNLNFLLGFTSTLVLSMSAFCEKSGAFNPFDKPREGENNHPKPSFVSGILLEHYEQIKRESTVDEIEKLIGGKCFVKERGTENNLNTEVTCTSDLGGYLQVVIVTGGVESKLYSCGGGQGPIARKNFITLQEDKPPTNWQSCPSRNR